MQTVRDACQLQPNALSIKLSDQIEQLDELITAAGDGTQFFEKTYITQGMQALISEGMARLAGLSTQGVFHLKQAMGGGKTHLLVGFGLLAKHPTLRQQYCRNIPHAQAFEVTDIATFNGRNNPDHFFWGEIANQLGKGEHFKTFWTSGPKTPDEKDWLTLFDGGTPILILLDEMPPYFHYLDTQKVGNGTVADIATRAFANLITAAGKNRNVCVVVSDLAASYDTGTRLINRALEDARAELGRQERNITPVDLAANEIYDIIRKRLFTSLPDQAEISDITPEGRYYFDRQENLTKLLQSLAHDAPENQVDDLMRHRLAAMFKPTRKTTYDDVLPLPHLEDVADRVRRGRVLLIVSPDAKIPPEEVQKFFEGLSQKNNLCVLTGDKTAMGSVENAARQFYAAQKADGRIPKGHPQRDELERKQQTYEQDLNATILNLFDKVCFPIQRAGRLSQLASKALDMTRDATRPFDGEAQIEKTLTSNPLKLYLDVEKEFDPIRDKAQDLLWLENQDDARWSDVADRYTEQAGMPWLPPRGLDLLKSIACNRGLWEDLGNGYVTRKPQKKKTSVQVIVESEPDDSGTVRLRINAQNAGPAPRIYYVEDGTVSEVSPQLLDQNLTTRALRVNFLVMDPSGHYETGEVVTWSNKLVLRNRLSEEGGKRTVELLVAPTGDIRYTLDGSEPREGTLYDKPVDIGDGEVLLRAFAATSGLEAKADFHFPARVRKGYRSTTCSRVAWCRAPVASSTHVPGRSRVSSRLVRSPSLSKALSS